MEKKNSNQDKELTRDEKKQQVIEEILEGDLDDVAGGSCSPTCFKVKTGP